MKNCIRLAALWACLCGWRVGALEPAGSLTLRRGLPNTAWRLEQKEPVTIAFLGGSITYLGGKNGYVHQVGEWFRTTYPDSDITVVNAGVSGTDSRFGAKRLDRDVLEHKPDVLLIEFAVNDGDRDHTEHMERILHKAWQANPKMDIVIFYTLAKNMLPHYDEGHLPPSAQAHERVAAHYQIPTIGLAHDVAAKLRAGEIQWEDFANDSCHPHAKGYGHFVESFRSALPLLLKDAGVQEVTLPTPLTKNLVVYPKPVNAAPLSIPDFVDDTHGKAARSFVLPQAGVHWVGEPAFEGEDGKSLWRLHYLGNRRKQPLDDTLGLTKADWSGNTASWFEEDASFTGSNSYPVYQKHQQRLGWTDRDSGVLVFIAPETGLYRYRLSTDGYVRGWRLDETKASLHLVHFAWGAEKGTSLKTLTTPMVEKGAPALSLSGEVKLVAGEELVIVVNSNAPSYSRGGFHHLKVSLGLYRSP